MSIPTSGSVIQSAVRANVDQPGAGSLMDRAVINQINKTGGPVRLTDFRGAINGTQRHLNPSMDSMLPYHMNKALYANAYNYSSVTMSGGTVTCTAYVDPDGYSEGGAECRVAGYQSAGPARIVASANCTGGVSGTDAGAAFGQMSLIYSTAGWLAGLTEVLASEQGPPNKNYSLDSGSVSFGSQVFISFIGYSIVYEGYGQDNGTCIFNNMLVRQV